MNVPAFSIIVVSWNTRELLRECLQSIVDEPGVVVVSDTQMPVPVGVLPVEVLVVDNASDDDSAAMVRTDFPQMRLFANTENTGFAAANNQAIAQARGATLFLLNPDAYLVPGALAALHHFLHAHPEAAAVGPNVLNPDGSWQAASFRFATVWDLFCEAVFLSVLWPHSPLFARRELGGFNRDTVREVDWVQGCALIIRRPVWDAVGPFDEGYWMYVEELDWSRRAHLLGYRIFFTPDAQVVHYGKRSVARARARVLPLGYRSHFRYYRKFDGPRYEAAVRGIAVLQMSLRAAISAAMIIGTRGEQRARWRENWRAYTGVLREALGKRVSRQVDK